MQWSMFCLDLCTNISFSIVESELSHAIWEAQNTFIQNNWSKASHMENASETSSSIRTLASNFSGEEGFLQRKENICVLQGSCIRNQVMIKLCQPTHLSQLQWLVINILGIDSLVAHRSFELHGYQFWSIGHIRPLRKCYKIYILVVWTCLMLQDCPCKTPLRPFIN